MLQIFKIKSERYPFLKIFWVVLAINVVMSLIGLVVILSTSSLENQFNWSRYFSIIYLLKQILGIFITAIFFYYTLNHFNKIIKEKKKPISFIPPILTALIAWWCYHSATYYTLEVKIAGEMKEKISTGLLFFSFSISAVFLTGLSLSIAWLNSLTDEKKQRKVLEQQKMELEVEKSQANLNFLKAQINPHFLHNTLNFLYAKALPLSDELSEGIATLSDIMRYALNDGNNENGKALLREEIEHVQNVIKINQLRFSNNLQVDFSVEGVVNGARIIPFVLITLVENAFKHGDLKSAENPIVIKIKVDQNKLFFYCRNKKKSGPKELSTGLGLDNIKNRLQLAYGNNYNFIVKDEMDFYTTELIIDNL
jgi:two-component system LytT family sensor kinase